MSNQRALSLHARQTYASTPHFRQEYASGAIPHGRPDTANEKDTVLMTANVWFKNGKTMGEVTAGGLRP